MFVLAVRNATNLARKHFKLFSKMKKIPKGEKVIFSAIPTFHNKNDPKNYKEKQKRLTEAEITDAKCYQLENYSYLYRDLNCFPIWTFHNVNAPCQTITSTRLTLKASQCD